MTPNNVPLVTLPSHFKSLNWFPGHMYKAIKDIQDRLSKTQGFIEVRDARIPITSTHPKLNEWTKISNKKHIILLNKMDLADERKTKLFVEKIQRESKAFVIPCCLNSPKSLQPLLAHWKDSLGTDSSNFWSKSTYLICGLPNVGKSTLINSLRMIGLSQRKAATTGPQAGVTRRLSNCIKILENPKLYIWDTPGIMLPNFDSPLQGWRLALLGCFKDHLVNEEKLAECLWHHRYLFDQIPSEATFYSFISNLAQKIHAFEKGGILDIRKASTHFIHTFRSGKLGQITLDEVHHHMKATA